MGSSARWGFLLLSEGSPAGAPWTRRGHVRGGFRCRLLMPSPQRETTLSYESSRCGAYQASGDWRLRGCMLAAAAGRNAVIGWGSCQAAWKARRWASRRTGSGRRHGHKLRRLPTGVPLDENRTERMRLGHAGRRDVIGNAIVCRRADDGRLQQQSVWATDAFRWRNGQMERVRVRLAECVGRGVWRLGGRHGDCGALVVGQQLARGALAGQRGGRMHGNAARRDLPAARGACRAIAAGACRPTFFAVLATAPKLAPCAGSGRPIQQWANRLAYLAADGRSRARH
jgi:hypothetical protein